MFFLATYMFFKKSDLYAIVLRMLLLLFLFSTLNDLSAFSENIDDHQSRFWVKLHNSKFLSYVRWNISVWYYRLSVLNQIQYHSRDCGWWDVLICIYLFDKKYTKVLMLSNIITHIYLLLLYLNMQFIPVMAKLRLFRSYYSSLQCHTILQKSF